MKKMIMNKNKNFNNNTPKIRVKKKKKKKRPKRTEFFEEKLNEIINSVSVLNTSAGSIKLSLSIFPALSCLFDTTCLLFSKYISLQESCYARKHRSSHLFEPNRLEEIQLA